MKIVHYPHPALRFQAKPISSIDKKIKLQIGEMFDLMYEAKGLGLAATQVALPFQLLVMNVSGDPDKKEHEFVYINPTLVERKGTMDGGISPRCWANLNSSSSSFRAPREASLPMIPSLSTKRTPLR
ncbi:hypothetical protein EB008_06875 [bacterium]|nr:hypothetical protein [bacterium]